MIVGLLVAALAQEPAATEPVEAAVSARGTVLTNAHVVESATRIEAQLADGRIVGATLLGLDTDLDLAVLRLPADAGVPPVALGRSRELKAGETVVAIGNPYGLGQTITTGVVSQTLRALEVRKGVSQDYVQTDAAINPGNSGGALLNLDGELVGINTVVLAKAQNIGFAIPSDRALKVARDLGQHGTVQAPWLGVDVKDVSPRLLVGTVAAEGAVLVSRVSPSDPVRAALSHSHARRLKSAVVSCSLFVAPARNSVVPVPARDTDSLTRQTSPPPMCCWVSRKASSASASSTPSVALGQRQAQGGGDRVGVELEGGVEGLGGDLGGPDGLLAVLHLDHHLLAGPVAEAERAPAARAVEALLELVELVALAVDHEPHRGPRDRQGAEVVVGGDLAHRHHRVQRAEGGVVLEVDLAAQHEGPRGQPRQQAVRGHAAGEEDEAHAPRIAAQASRVTSRGPTG